VRPALKGLRVPSRRQGKEGKKKEIIGHISFAISHLSFKRIQSRRSRNLDSKQMTNEKWQMIYDQ
jgi:hypothetical protein